MTPYKASIKTQKYHWSIFMPLIDPSGLGLCNQLPLMEYPLYGRHISGFYIYNAFYFFSTLFWLLCGVPWIAIFLHNSLEEATNTELRSVSYIITTITMFIFTVKVLLSNVIGSFFGEPKSQLSKRTIKIVHNTLKTFYS